MTNATEYDPTLDDGPPDPRTVTAGPGPDYVTGIDHSLAEVRNGTGWPEGVRFVVTTDVALARSLVVRASGALTFDGMVVGRVDHDPDGAPRLTVNLGWLKAAGLGLTVQNDPDVDTGRKGHVLQRPEPQPAPEPF